MRALDADGDGYRRNVKDCVFIQVMLFPCILCIAKTEMDDQIFGLPSR